MVFFLFFMVVRGGIRLSARVSRSFTDRNISGTPGRKLSQFHSANLHPDSVVTINIITWKNFL
jgi:hypothetical protein